MQEPKQEHKLSKRQRQRRNQALRKAGIAGCYGDLSARAQTEVDKRCQLSAMMRDPKQAPGARQEYKRISGGSVGERVNLTGWYKGNHAKGRKRVQSRMELAAHYAAKFA